MKKLLFMLCVLCGSIIMSMSVMAAEKTDAYKKLMNTITYTYYDEYGTQIYVDAYGYLWEADHTIGKNNMNTLTLTARVYDYDIANQIYNRLGGDVYFDVPITLKDIDDFYEIMVVVYKGTNVSLTCARPVELYPSGYKILGEWNSNDTDVLMFKTNETESFRIYTLLNGIADGVRCWGNGFVPEEYFYQ